MVPSVTLRLCVPLWLLSEPVAMCARRQRDSLPGRSPHLSLHSFPNCCVSVQGCHCPNARSLGKNLRLATEWDRGASCDWDMGNQTGVGSRFWGHVYISVKRSHITIWGNSLNSFSPTLCSPHNNFRGMSVKVKRRGILGNRPI